MNGFDFDGLLLFRIVVMVAAAIMVALALSVLHVYYLVWSRQKRPSQMGLLPFHVWAISLSHLLAFLYMTYEILQYAKSGEPLTWRGPLVLTSSLLGIAALGSVLRFELKRKRALSKKVS